MTDPTASANLSNRALLEQLPGQALGSIPATEAQASMSELAAFFEHSLNLDTEAAVLKAASVWAKAKAEVNTSASSAAPSEKGAIEALSTSSLKDPFLHQRKIAGTIDKLNKENFVSWLMSFRNLIEGVPFACAHLEGVEHDADFFADGSRSANYDEHLDIELGRVLIQTLDPEARSIVMQAHNDNERRASVLYDLLKTELLRSDPSMQDYVHDTIHTLKQGSYEMRQLVQTFRFWFTYAALIGSPVTASEQVRHLLRSLHPRHNAFKTAANLARGKKTVSSRLRDPKDNEQSDFDFETLASRLIREEYELKSPSDGEHAFAIAMAASSNSPFPLPSTGTTTRTASPAKRGKGKGAARGRGGKSSGTKGSRSIGDCARCGTPGHYAKVCRQNWENDNVQKHQAKGAPAEHHAMQVAQQQ